MKNPSHFTFYLSRFWPLLVLPALVLLFFQKMAFSNLILARGDTFLYFYPYWEAAAAALRHGRVPLWNPDLFMGAPFLANSQAGFFYPPNWPVWWLLPVPYAVSASIIVHLMIAGWGTYWAGRRTLSLSRPAALLAALLFALGGYLTAQVEHINQLQGLAWLPWFLVVLGPAGAAHGAWRGAQRAWRVVLRRGTAVAVLFSLQLLAGHTQTAFITGAGVGLYLVAGSGRRAAGVMVRVWPLFVGAALAGLITAVQLLPTLELAQYSSRQGGLTANEVLSFSLHPLLLGPSLLPGYGRSLFTEYVAFLPLTALLLAGIGVGQWRQRPDVRPIAGVTAVTFILALGRFTPIYWLLARLPGFDLFRVPARWLVWYALGMALLAGLGWDVARGCWAVSGTAWPGKLQRPLRWTGLLIILLAGWSLLAVPLARFIPLGPEAPAAFPSQLTVLGWMVELMAGLLLFGLRSRTAAKFNTAPLFHLVILVSLFFASRSLPYNQLTTPEAYFDLRPPIARLQAGEMGAMVPGRLLSLSDIFFDPGDQAEIDTIYGDQLPEQARYDYTVAIKQKEIIAPNLPLVYGLASVDGFDGGILPLDSYSQLMRTILPEGVSTVDGRLREYLSAVPQPQWLDLFNARYLITDKTGDVWREAAPGFTAFFDLQHATTIAAGADLAVGYVPDFPATGLAVISHGGVGDIVLTSGGETWTIAPELTAENLWLARWPQEMRLDSIVLSASSGADWPIDGLTLVNLADQTFQPLVPGEYHLLHSGDVKIYENLDMLPRAFVVAGWQWAADVNTAVTLMQSGGFDPRQTAVLLGVGAPVSGRLSPADTAVTILTYEPERVVMQVESGQESLLVLTDAHYPGWQATVDGQPWPVYQADALFRAVIVPAGRHEVVFSFVSQSFVNGRFLSFLGLAIGLLLVVIVGGRRKTAVS